MSTESRESVQHYWDAVAQNFDCEVTNLLTIQARRRLLWQHLSRAFASGQRILELNCGTGVDAVYLAERGVRVVACDVSFGMVEVARRRIIEHGVVDRVKLCVLATERIAELSVEATFDGALSCFSGLNCVGDLSGVARDLSLLLRPGAVAVITMMGKLVPWEILWLLAHGRPGKALRRMRKHGAETDPVRVYRYSMREVRDAFRPYFILREWKGLGIAVPPSYMESWAQRFRRTTAVLSHADAVLQHVPLVRNF